MISDNDQQIIFFEEKNNNGSKKDSHKKMIIAVLGLLLCSVVFSLAYYNFLYKRADLSVTDLETEIYAEKSDKFVKLEGVIKNSGRRDVEGNIDIEILENGKKVASEQIKGLKMNESIDFSKTIEKIDSGTHLYKIVIDPEKKIGDLMRSNNNGNYNFEVPRDLPDLKMRSVYFNGVNLVDVEYCNEWTGVSDKKFQFKVSTKDGVYNGSPFWPVAVPAPGECIRPYVTIEAIGAKKEDIRDVSVVLDFKNDIEEIDENNNEYVQEVDFRKSVKCRDDDGGKNYYKAGMASTPVTGGFVDCCYTTNVRDSFDFACAEEGPYLSEAYCNSYDEPKRDDIFECPDGCKKGVCINDENRLSLQDKEKIEPSAVVKSGPVSAIDFTIKNKSGKIMSGVICQVLSDENGKLDRMMEEITIRSDSQGKCIFQNLNPEFSYTVAIYWVQDYSKSSMVSLGKILAGNTETRTVTNPY
jgi:hypothetical protein